VATGLRSGVPARVTAWGLQNWSKLDDEDGFALSYPGIAALQLGADVLTDGKRPEQLDCDPAWKSDPLRRGIGVQN